MSTVEQYRDRARRYPVSVVPGDTDPYIAETPDFPHAVAAGDTPQEALEEALNGVASILEVLEAEGLQAPEPMSSYSGQFSVRLPRSLHRALANRAQAEGVSLNAEVALLLAQSLALDDAITLPRRRRARAKSTTT